MNWKIDKDESQRIRTEIRRILLEVWDPIGIKDIPEAQDEYDCCLGDVLHLLMGKASDDEIADYLFSTATEHMGLTVERLQMLPTAAALRNIELPENS